MEDVSMGKPLSDDELLAKCGKNEPFTNDELDIKDENSNGLVSLQEGLNILTYSGDKNREKK